jgi:hypothetical protein
VLTLRNLRGSNVRVLNGNSRSTSRSSFATPSIGSRIPKASTAKFWFSRMTQARSSASSYMRTTTAIGSSTRWRYGSDQQTRGFGKLVLGTVLDNLSERYAGHIATWLVAPANFASHAMSEAVGADVTYPAETKPNALYAIAL